MPDHGRAFATFAEEPTGGMPADPGPWRGPFGDESAALEAHWRAFGRAATVVAVLTAPVFFLLLSRVFSWTTPAAALVTVLAVFAFRGLVDVITRRYIPSPSLFGEDATHRERDIVDRRRTAFWRFWFKVTRVIGSLYVLTVLIILVVQVLQDDVDAVAALTAPWDAISSQFAAPGAAKSFIGLAISLPIIFFANTIIFLGPLAFSGIKQIKTYEPGDASWGHRMADVRGQAGAREAVRNLVTLWQAGDEFERLGGKRERGVLFVGPPGTGKTMLAKTIATNFNAPFVSAPAPAFSQAFIGVDILLVMWMGWRARRLARKWGGQCIVFIDEIDVIGGGRAGVLRSHTQRSIHDVAFHGPMGSLTSSGDLVLESAAWRERLFVERAMPRAQARPAFEKLRQFVFPGTGGIGQGGLQQLLVEMDGIATPPLMRKFLTNRINTLLDATFIVPPRIGQVTLRLPPVRPRKEEVFYIGACNVPVSALDPALTRPGRLGRTIEFRTPNRKDRADIIDLYLDKIAREPDLDTDERRDELARLTMGHSPAMIEQVCALALSNAHFDGRTAANWPDVVDAITLISYGVDRNLDFQPDEARAIAIHEAGHAVTGHVFMKEHASTRLSLRARGFSLGHHAMAEIEERHSAFTHQKFADLVWSLGAMAAELVIYGETSTGVGGDIASATSTALLMVGDWGMAATRPDLRERSATPSEAAIAERKLFRRYQQTGLLLMNRSRSADLEGEAADKRLEAAAFIGQAFLTAYWFIRHNRVATERLADLLLERQEIYGDEVVQILNDLNLTIPEIDPLDERNWPRL